jgi:hypothetical protein
VAAVFCRGGVLLGLWFLLDMLEGTALELEWPQPPPLRKAVVCGLGSLIVG